MIFPCSDLCTSSEVCHADCYFKQKWLDHHGTISKWIWFPWWPRSRPRSEKTGKIFFIPSSLRGSIIDRFRKRRKMPNHVLLQLALDAKSGRSAVRRHKRNYQLVCYSALLFYCNDVFRGISHWLVTPHARCRLRQLKMERVKDYLLLEQEFVQNQERLRGREHSERSQVETCPFVANLTVVLGATTASR